MNRFSLNIDKLLVAILFVLREFEGHILDFHKLVKILYFADQKHLAEYGRPILGDRYIAMKNGPVPSTVYDILKGLRGDAMIVHYRVKAFSQFLTHENKYHIKATSLDAHFDLLSESEIECLLLSISENKDLNFNQLTEKSHDSAWEHAENDEMDILSIAKAGGADEEMLKYIALNAENESLLA